MDYEKFVNFVKKSLKELNLNCTMEQIELFYKYLKLLEKWNKSYNLTSIKNFEQIIILHLFDSLTCIKFFNENDKNIVDLGTGGGLPGVILAIYYQDKNFTLLDCVNKKIQFLIYVKNSLHLNNIFPMHIRIENFKDKNIFDVAISRAFSNIDLFYKLSKPLVKNKGKILAMKANIKKEEFSNFPYFYKKHKIKVPFLDSNRNIIEINL